jgi:hypothetical protein
MQEKDGEKSNMIFSKKKNRGAGHAENMIKCMQLNKSDFNFNVALSLILAQIGILVNIYK